MLKAVKERKAHFNNDPAVAKSKWLSFGKLVYYRAFSVAYALAGSCADVVMVNSTWTSGHINNIWRVPKKTNILYPPCDTRNLSTFPLGHRKSTILSVAQFRPEKNHGLQLDAMALLFKSHPELKSANVKLVLLGSVRNSDDQTIVDKLIVKIKQLDLIVITRLT